MRGVLEIPPLRRWLAALVLATAVGCGGGSTNIPVSTLETGGIDLTGRSLALELEDGLKMEFRVSRMEYPYIWGSRFVGERMPRREMRIDLRTVKKLAMNESR